MRKLIICTVILICLAYAHVYGISDSRNGLYIPTEGTFRIFVVFAEVTGDPSYNQSVSGWNAGEMPTNPNIVVDAQVSQNYQTYVSKYFQEISFDTLNVIGDYCPKLIQIPYNSNGDKTSDMHSVFQALKDSANGQQIQTPNGFQFPNDFDLWTLNSSEGLARTFSPDGYIDCIIVDWRDNNHIATSRSGGNMWGSSYQYSLNIVNKSGVTMFGEIYSNDMSILQHELSHNLVGDNTFHCAPTNDGEGMFIEDYSGYSILSGNGRNLKGYNGWDRYRLGWKNPQQQYPISAQDTSGQEKNGDLIYGEDIGDSATYILRDFATTNDAVRIKLPYIRTLNSQAREQWLWIENHQLMSSNVEYNSRLHGANSPMSKIPKGIRINIQIGNEDFTQFHSSRTNFISPLSRFGKYDFTYQNGILLGDGNIGYLAITDSAHSNPFVGMGFNTHPVDIDSDDVLQTREYVLPGEIQYNGAILGTENFGYYNYPVFGSVYDAFYPGDKISISTNPTNTPWLTYRRKSGKLLSPYLSPATDDNRYIYLNGLCIHVLEQRTNGDMKISIRWNDFDIKNNVRWCGDIVLNEKVIVKPNCTILLDQGLSPVRPVNPITFNGEKIFASPTTFTCNDSSEIKVESTGSIDLKNNSSIIAQAGSTININSGANITVESGSTLQLKAGANLNITGSGKIVIKPGAYLCVESGANINLQDYNSLIVLEDNAQYGANPAIFSSPSCGSTITKTGNGSVIDYNQDVDVYIQNQTLSSSKYIVGKNIYVGNHVDSNQTYGNVTINNGANVIFDCKNITFDKGFECAKGSTFEVLNH